METFIELIKAILPAILVFLTAWLLLEKYLGNLPISTSTEKDKSHHSQKLAILLPLQLKAYERLIIYMERINPSALVMRVNQSGMSAVQLQLELLKAIREEHEHNQSLQIYVEEDTWNMIITAKEEVISLVKIASGKVNTSEASSSELARVILEIDGSVKKNPVKQTIDQLRVEAKRKLF